MSTPSQNKKNAEIIGVFSKAVYVESDNKIFVFHDKKWGYVPFGIAVDNIEKFIEKGGFEVGKSIEIPGIKPKKAEFSGLCKPSEKRIAEVEKIIKEYGSTGGIIEYYNKFDSVKTNIDALFAALCEGRDAEKYAVKLIGLGRGLTPSGDDFLSGMFSLLFAAGFDVKSMANAVKDNLSRTSRISGAYLRAVLEREHFTIYENAVKAFLGDCAEYAKEVLPLGASSGTDTLCGALFAAKVIEKTSA